MRSDSLASMTSRSPSRSGHWLDADSFFAHWGLMRSRAWGGHYDSAIAMAPALLRDSGRHQWALARLAWAYGKAGQGSAAHAAYEEMEARSRHEFLAPSWLAIAAASAGLVEESFAYLQRAVADRDPLVLKARLSPFWDVARRHPRFDDVTHGIWR
jgi:tetratricopeptide (TPR) repeat protein